MNQVLGICLRCTGPCLTNQLLCSDCVTLIHNLHVWKPLFNLEDSITDPPTTDNDLDAYNRAMGVIK